MQQLHQQVDRLTLLAYARAELKLLLARPHVPHHPPERLDRNLAPLEGDPGGAGDAVAAG
jgi:hypothetical protein